MNKSAVAPPLCLQNGFRLFFFSAALLAIILIAVWTPEYFGWIALPSALSPIAWHAHEMLFGYVPAVIAGFLLTATPNWTGRAPITGAPLLALFALWLIGRIAIAGSAAWPAGLTVFAALLFPIALIATMAREIILAGNKRNLKVIAVIGLLGLAQGLFYWEFFATGRVVYADRMALAVILLLIMIIGGRIIPNFTGNWIAANNPGRMPVAFNGFDKIVLAVSIVALAFWVLSPLSSSARAPLKIASGFILIGAGGLHVVRQIRWTPWRCLKEPLAAILHVAYSFAPLGFFLAGLAAWDLAAPAAAIHAWSVGAIGVMTLAVMTRAIRGHTGRPLHAPLSTVVLYAAMIFAALARIFAAQYPQWSVGALELASLGWIGAFLIFVALYGPMMLRPAPNQAGAALSH